MNVYAKRKQLAVELRRRLGEAFLVVPNPDHPLLLRAPDILVGGVGRAVSIFFPSASELRKLSYFKARFVLSKLALPAETRTVLVSETLDDELTDKFRGDFDLVVSWKDREKLINVFEQETRSSIPPDVVKYTQRRFAQAIELTAIMRRISRGDDYDSEVRSSSRSSARFSIDRVDGTEVAFFDSGQFDATSALSIIGRSTDSAIELDNGVPYLLKPENSLALVEEWSFYPGDPDKVLRASAFAGWSVMSKRRGDLLDSATGFLRKRGVS